MSQFRATAVHVTIRLREPLSLVTRANLINAGVPASTAAAWAELDHGRPVLAVAAHVEIDQLHCLADVPVVAQIVVEDDPCSPAPDILR